MTSPTPSRLTALPLRGAAVPLPDFVRLPWHARADRALANHRTLWLVGPPGSGKTRYADEWSLQQRGRPADALQGDPKADFYSFWGRPTLVGAETVFVAGPLARALEHGGVFVLNDATLVPVAVLGALLPAAEERWVTNPVTQEVVPVPAGFRLVLTSNPENYRCKPNLATLQSLVHRSLVVEVEAQDSEQVLEMLRVRFPTASRGLLEQAVSAWEEYRSLAKDGGKDDSPMRLTYREAEQFASLVTAGVSGAEATRVALVGKYFLDPDAHDAARMRQDLREEG